MDTNNSHTNESENQIGIEASKPELKRRLGLWSVIAIGVGVTIGTGIFSTMSEVAATAGSAIVLILAFAIGGLLQIPANFVYAELASAYPEDGGYYIYIREAGSKRLAFLTGWACFWAIDPPSISIMALGLVGYLGVILPFGDSVLRIIAVCVILLFMFIHLRTVKGGGIVQTVLTVLKILPFIVIVGIGIFFINGNFFTSTTPEAAAQVGNSQFWILALLGAVSATTFAYDGMYAASYVSGEVKNPKKTMPAGLIITAVVITVLYFLLTFVSSGLIDINELASGSAPMALVASKLPAIGNVAGPVVAIMSIIVIIGSISSAIMYQPRMGYAMAKDGYFFSIFGKISKKYNSPYGAIIAHSLFAAVLALLFDLKDLLIYFTFISLIKNFVAIFSIFVLRNKDEYKPSYICPWGYVLPIISCGLNAVLIVTTFIQHPMGCIFALAVVVFSGLAAFEIWDKRRINKSSKDGK